MFSVARAFLLVCLLVELALVVRAEGVPPAPAGAEFTVMAYNVENLFDLDRVTSYDDYVENPTDPNSYAPTKLLKKLKTISTVLKSVNGGKGPDVVILNELEVDHTPDSSLAGMKDFLRKFEGTNYEKMLTSELSDELRGLPIEAWLLKALEDEGLKSYEIIIGDLPQNAKEHEDAIKVGILSRFPVLSHQTWDTPSARGILEVVLQVGDNKLIVFGNHWKSGAGNPAMENIRLGNAQTLRDRLDQILSEDPQADVIIGGDFNTQYNQGQRYSFMTKTAIQDVLGSQGDAKALGGEGKPDLYNLWFDVEPEQRFTDEFNGEWGTLIQLLVSRGLGDHKGVEYVPGTFHHVMIPGVNCRDPLGLPWHWTNYGPGAGASDHFPVVATFRMVQGDASASVLRAKSSEPQKRPVKVGYDTLDRSKLRNASVLKDASDEEMAKAIGEIFVVEGVVSKKRPVLIQVGGKEYSLYSYDENLRKVFQTYEKGQIKKLLGELGLFKGKLQFVVQDPSWLK
ncbi:hypothetical protein EBX31_01430 [bacterium]|nr:hypothetical protein [bacterium]